MTECDYCGRKGHTWQAHPEAHADVARWQREVRREAFPFGDHQERNDR